MLNRYFKYPGVLRRMRLGPLRTEIDIVADDLERAGYTYLSAKRYLSLIASFSRYALKSGCVRVQAVDHPLVEQYLGRPSLSCSTASTARSALGHVLRRLGRHARPVHLSASERRDAVLLARFDTYLHDVRGLEAKSREELLRAARRTIVWYREARPYQPLSRFSAQDVLAYAFYATHRCTSHRTRSAAMSHLRNFLRYLHWSAICGENFSRYVPRVPIWTMAGIPEYLPWDDARRVIDSIDISDPVGKRDRALLTLVATTGMRNAELRRLELGDIRWREGEVQLRRTKNRRDRIVPLLTEAGRALSDYLLHGRPPTPERRIFLCHRPPVRPFRTSGTVSSIVRRRLARLGIRPVRAGTHLLRHSLATRMVQQERPVKEVADLLGHQHIDTTAVYVKVALPQLAMVALPFPGGAA
ncbi:MAG: site-specific integrase [Terriglobia bacterium]|jgi:site-specific recombinase XerD